MHTTRIDLEPNAGDTNGQAGGGDGIHAVDPVDQVKSGQAPRWVRRAVADARMGDAGLADVGKYGVPAYRCAAVSYAVECGVVVGGRVDRHHLEEGRREPGSITALPCHAMLACDWEPCSRVGLLQHGLTSHGTSPRQGTSMYVSCMYSSALSWWWRQDPANWQAAGVLVGGLHDAR